MRVCELPIGLELFGIWGVESPLADIAKLAAVGGLELSAEGARGYPAKGH
jgi:hypothetical protein